MTQTQEFIAKMTKSVTQCAPYRFSWQTGPTECSWVHDLTEKLMQVTVQVAEQSPDGAVKRDVLAKMIAVCSHLKGAAHCLTVNPPDREIDYRSISVLFDLLPFERPAPVDPELLALLEAPGQPDVFID